MLYFFFASTLQYTLKYIVKKFNFSPSFANMFIVKRNPFVHQCLYREAISTLSATKYERGGPVLQFITNFNSNYYSRLTHRTSEHETVNVIFMIINLFVPDNYACNPRTTFLVHYFRCRRYVETPFNLGQISFYPMNILTSVYNKCLDYSYTRIKINQFFSFFRDEIINKNDQFRFHVTRAYLFFLKRVCDEIFLN